MRFKTIAFILALSIAAWAQTSNPAAQADSGQSPAQAPKASCACCDKTTNAKDASNCCAHDGKNGASCARKGVKSCCGKNAKSCTRNDKDKIASCCGDSCMKDKNVVKSCCEKCTKDGQNACSCAAKAEQSAKNCCSRPHAS